MYDFDIELSKYKTGLENHSNGRKKSEGCE
jgi:hypothetical protein